MEARKQRCDAAARRGVCLAACLLLAAVAFVLATPVASGGQAGETLHSLTGRIELESGVAPNDRLEVSLRPLLGGASRIIFSESGGRFVFSGIRAGTYVVKVEVPRTSQFQDGEAEVQVFANPVPSNFFVTVVLRAKAPVVVAPLGGRTIDANETDSSIPKVARKSYERGVKAAARGRSDDAIAHFRKAIEVAPDYLFALNDLGVHLTRRAKYEEAVGLLRRAVALAPSSFPPQLNLAIALLGAEKFDEAGAAATRAVEIDASAAEPHFVAARIAWRMGDRESAAENYDRAFRLGGFDLAIAQFELGRLYEEMGYREAAARAYATFLTIVRSGPEADEARNRLRALGVA